MTHPAACIHHLERAIAIQCERDRSKWPALIDALPDEAREPCRAWLENELNPPRRDRAKGKRMSPSYLRDTHKRVAAVLADGALTAGEIAARLGCTYDGVASCLNGMRNRQEVVALKPRRQGEPRRYRLREVAA